MKYLLIPLILLMLIAGIRWQFGTARHYSMAVSHALEDGDYTAGDLITEDDLKSLPPLVQRYLQGAGVVGTPHVQAFRVRMTGQMKIDRNKDYAPVRVEQYTFTDPGIRLFYITMNFNGIPINGVHHYDESDALMKIKLLDLVTVVNESGGVMQQAETVTYFNDLVLMAPGALLREDIVWETLDEKRVRGTLRKHGNEVSAVLEFNADGMPENFLSEDRYAAEQDGSMSRIPWSTPMSAWGQVGAFTLPYRGEAVWHYPDGDFSYIELNIEDIVINPEE